MKFKCNYCERIIPFQKMGAAEIKCFCGATYRKQLTVTVTDETPQKGT